MNENRCKHCLWWDSQHARLDSFQEAKIGSFAATEIISTPGLCRKHKPGAMRVGEFYVGMQPVMDAEDFCGEFRIANKE